MRFGCQQEFRRIVAIVSNSRYAPLPNPPITAGEVCAAGVEAAKCCAALHLAGALATMEGEGLSS